MTGWWVHYYWQTGQATILVALIFWVIASITLHELAHGWAALYEGDDTPRVTGHMTANPVVHMGMPSLIVFLLFGIAWGLMPVNPQRFRHKKYGRIIVSAAGPVMNLILAAITLTISAFLVETDKGLALFFYTGGWINLILFTLNLLPVPPLDGSVILANLSPRIAELYRHPKAGLAGLLFFLALLWTGMGDAAFNVAKFMAKIYVEALSSLISTIF